MPVIVEDVSDIPLRGSSKKRPPKGKYVSESSRMVEKLRSLGRGQCLTILPETDDLKELQRKRVHWCIAAKRAGIRIVSRSAVTDAGDRAIRIWRLDA